MEDNCLIMAPWVSMRIAECLFCRKTKIEKSNIQNDKHGFLIQENEEIGARMEK